MSSSGFIPLYIQKVWRLQSSDVYRIPDTATSPHPQGLECKIEHGISLVARMSSIAVYDDAGGGNMAGLCSQPQVLRLTRWWIVLLLLQFKQDTNPTGHPTPARTIRCSCSDSEVSGLLIIRLSTEHRAPRDTTCEHVCTCFRARKGKVWDWVMEVEA